MFVDHHQIVAVLGLQPFFTADYLGRSRGSRRFIETPAASACAASTRGGFGTKLHLKCDGHGRPLAFTLSPSQAHDQTQLEALLDAGAVKPPGRPGRPRLRPAALVGDKGYARRKARKTIRRRGIRPVIPSKADEPAQAGFDRELYPERNRVERLVNRLKRWRKIATRYEKRALYYAAFVTLAIIREWLSVESRP